MHRIETIHRLSQNRTHPHAHNPAPTTALDGLNPPHPGVGTRGGRSRFPVALLSIFLYLTTMDLSSVVGF
jgi:hypothetical protein